MSGVMMEPTIQEALKKEYAKKRRVSMAMPRRVLMTLGSMWGPPFQSL
jgi:hypothetical protein